ncbi:MAG: hypothetical protein QM733_15015 [Ilumatobacteraceae bacterium]
MTAASIHSGRPAGRANGVTPPIVIPVIAEVSSAPANDALRAPSRRRTAPLTSSRVVASTTQATCLGGSDLPTTTIVFAESSRAMPYASQNAAVSASAGSQGITSTVRPIPAATSAASALTRLATVVLVPSASPVSGISR